jgi:hypothetical protein
MRLFPFTLAAILALACACDGRPGPAKSGLSTLPDPSVFAIMPLEATYCAGGKLKGYTCEVSKDSGGMVLRVLAEDAVELKAAAFRLEYDPARWRVESAAGLGSFDETDALALLADCRNCAKLKPGLLEFNAVLIDPEHAAGYTGGGAVAELRFAQGPEPRQASATPGFRDFVRDLTLSGDGAWLSWTYRNTGDYDLNGEAASSDLVQIAMHYLANSSSTTWDTARMADGDGNGEVNQADIVPIAQNYLGRVSGYQVWGANGVAETWTHFGNATLEVNLRTDASRPYFNVDVSGAGYSHYMLWPYDGSDDEGLWSNIAYAGNSPRRVFLNLIER